jgi:phenylacetate-CoA ligase
MPVVRYRTRDLTRLLPGTARPGMRRMEKVTGRTDDMMIVRGVNVFPTQVEELVLALPGLSPYFQCVLTRPDRLDALEIVAEAGEDVPTSSYEGLGRELAGRVKERIGVTASVRVVPPGGIERSVGKARRIVDQRH